MRNLSFCVKNCDKKFLLSFLITLGCSIICGIVLCSLVKTNIYFINFGNEYVFNVFSFDSTPLFFTHFLADAIYFYAFFLICYFTKFKYFTLIFLYIRGLTFGIYTAILFGVTSLSGSIVAIFVFIPATLVSFIICFLITETCRKFDKWWALLLPLALSLIDSIILILFVNVVFRIVIIIV